MKKLLMLIFIISLNVFSQQRLTDENKIDLLVDDNLRGLRTFEIGQIFIVTGALRLISVAGIMAIAGINKEWNQRRRVGITFNIIAVPVAITQIVIGKRLLEK